MFDTKASAKIKCHWSSKNERKILGTPLVVKCPTTSIDKDITCQPNQKNDIICQNLQKLGCLVGKGGHTPFSKIPPYSRNPRCPHLS